MNETDIDLEVRIVAMVHGEVSQQEELELRHLISSRPELQRFFDDVYSTHCMIGGLPEAQPRMSDRRRKNLLKQLNSRRVVRKKVVSVIISAAAVLTISALGLSVFLRQDKTVSVSENPGIEKSVKKPEPKPEPVKTVEVRRFEVPDFDARSSVEVPQDKGNDSEFLSKSGSTDTSLPTSKPEIVKPPTPAPLKDNRVESAKVRTQLKSLDAKIETASRRLKQVQELYLSIPEIVELQRGIANLRNQIAAKEQSIATLEEIKNSSNRPVKELFQLWETRPTKLPTEKKTGVDIEPVAGSGLPLKPDSGATFQDQITYRTELLMHLQDQFQRYEEVLQHYFPEGKIPNTADLNSMIASTRNNLETSIDREKILEEEVVRLLIARGLNIEMTQSREMEPEKFQSTIDRVSNQWAFAVVKGGRSAGLQIGESLLVIRSKQVVAKLTVTSIEENQAVASIVSESLMRGVKLVPGDVVVRE